MAGINEAALIGFNRDLNALMRKHIKQANRIKQKVAFDILQQLIERSPVDTGFFRANWLVSLHQPADELVGEEGRPVGVSMTVGRGGAVIALAKLGDDIWFSNNVPYAEALEAGHSGQAPAGVVGPVIEAARQAIVEQL